MKQRSLASAATQAAALLSPADAAAVTHRIKGTPGNDVLNGTDDPDVINAGAGNDRLFGNGGDDVLKGGAGNDRMRGGDGADRLDGGAGTNTLIGDDGADLVDYSARDVVVLRPDDRGRLIATVAGYSTDTLQSVETVIGGSGDDVLDAGTGSSAFNSWELHLLGGDGDDLIAGTNFAEGGAGDDLIYSVSGLLRPGAMFDGGVGHDTLSLARSGGAVDLAQGLFYLAGSGNSPTTITITGFEDVVGGAGGDIISGDDGANVLRGGAGNDILSNAGAVTGVDYLYGEADGDTFHLEAGSVVADGGTGNDLVSILGAGQAGDVFELHGGDGTDRVSLAGLGEAGTVDLVAGTITIAGGRSGTLDGFERVDGGAGDDVVAGSDGRDTIGGGGGADILTGRGGADVFVFINGSVGGAVDDRITDFSHAERDRINLSDLTADVSNDHGGKFTFVGTAAFSGAAGELRYEVVDGDTLISGDTNGDGAGDFSIRLDGVHALIASDFNL